MNTHHIKSWDTKLHELADGVFAYTQATGAFCIANAGFVAGDGEGVAIDALFAPRVLHMRPLLCFQEIEKYNTAAITFGSPT